MGDFETNKFENIMEYLMNQYGSLLYNSSKCSSISERNILQMLLGITELTVPVLGLPLGVHRVAQKFSTVSPVYILLF